MLKEYDPNFGGTHIVRVTFMAWAYVGHIAIKLGGNCKGADLLDADFLYRHTQEDIDHYAENDCSFTFDEAEKIYTATLRDKDGDELDVDGDSEEFRKMIVAIEFVDCIPE